MKATFEGKTPTFSIAFLSVVLLGHFFPWRNAQIWILSDATQKEQLVPLLLAFFFAWSWEDVFPEFRTGSPKIKMLEVGLAAPVLLVIVLGFLCASFTCTGACLGGELWVNDAVDFLEIIIVLKINPTLFMGNSLCCLRNFWSNFCFPLFLNFHFFSLSCFLNLFLCVFFISSCNFGLLCWFLFLCGFWPFV